MSAVGTLVAARAELGELRRQQCVPLPALRTAVRLGERVAGPGIRATRAEERVQHLERGRTGLRAALRVGLVARLRALGGISRSNASSKPLSATQRFMLIYVHYLL